MKVPSKKTTCRILAASVLILLVTVLHYLTRREETLFHVVYRELYFVPIILSGFWFGLRGGLTASLVITLLYVPVIISKPSGFAGHDMGNFLEILLFNIIGILVGWLRDREKRQQRKLLEAESLAAMGRAVSCIAHDMKSPLVAIGGFVRQVRRKVVEDDLAKKLDVAFEQVRRLEMLVKDMLAFARPLQLEKIPADINKLIAEALVVASETAGRRNIQIKDRLAADLPRLAIDYHRLYQAVLNLVINAIDASSEGETVTVHTIRRNKNIIIEVMDRGPGISPEIEKEIFKPFVSTKKEGTGLGLSIVKKVVEAHAGILSFYNNGQRGVTFRISLPENP